MTDRRRLAATIATAAGLSIAVAACGGSTATSKAARPSGTPAGAMLDAYTQTSSAKTAAMSISETIVGGGQTETLRGSGVVAFDGQRAELTFDVPKAGVFTIRDITPELYLQLPAADRSQLPAGKTWVAINLDTVAQSKFGASLSQLSDSSTQPTQVLAYLQSVSTGGVHQAGPATIGGTPTTEYTATIDLTKAAAKRSPQAVRATKKIEAALHRSTLPLQVWIDGQHRVRQMRYELPVPTSPTAPSGGSITSTIDLSHFGAPVTVQAPPAGQVDNVTNRVAGGS